MDRASGSRIEISREFENFVRLATSLEVATAVSTESLENGGHDGVVEEKRLPLGQARQSPRSDLLRLLAGLGPPILGFQQCQNPGNGESEREIQSGRDKSGVCFQPDEMFHGRSFPPPDFPFMVVLEVVQLLGQSGLEVTNEASLSLAPLFSYVSRASGDRLGSEIKARHGLFCGPLPSRAKARCLRIHRMREAVDENDSGAGVGGQKFLYALLDGGKKLWRKILLLRSVFNEERRSGVPSQNDHGEETAATRLLDKPGVGEKRLIHLEAIGDVGQIAALQAHTQFFLQFVSEPCCLCPQLDALIV